MLTSLRIRHFQAWEDTGPVRLAALTLFLGEHGTGKSSLGHALAALRRTPTSLPAPAQIDCTFDGDQAPLHWPLDATANAHPADALKHLTFGDAAQAGPDPQATARSTPWLRAMGLDDAHTGPSALHARRILSQLPAPGAGQTLWLEQPELLLHPRAQAVLMDAFIDVTQPAATGQPRNQLIIETHAEALLNRLQRRVAEGVIRADDIALYVCRRPGPHAELEALRQSPYGDIENWPDDLFGHDMSDVIARTLAAHRRRQADEPGRTP